MQHPTTTTPSTKHRNNEPPVAAAPPSVTGETRIAAPQQSPAPIASAPIATAPAASAPAASGPNDKTLRVDPPQLPAVASTEQQADAGRIPVSLPLPPPPAPPRQVQPPATPETKKPPTRKRRRRVASILRGRRAKHAWRSALLLLSGSVFGAMALLIVACLVSGVSLWQDSLATPASRLRAAGHNAAPAKTATQKKTVAPKKTTTMPFGFTDREEELDPGKTAASGAGDDTHQNDRQADSNFDRPFDDRLRQLRRRRARFAPRP